MKMFRNYLNHKNKLYLPYDMRDISIHNVRMKE